MDSIGGIDVFTGQAIEIMFNHSEIAGIRSITPVDGMSFLSPGWLDIQVNGWRGVDWNDDHLPLSDAEQLCLNLAARGTTRFLATVITAPRRAMASRLSRIMEIRNESALVRNHLAGIHIEGPFISPHDGPRGAHDPEAVRKPSVDELSSWREIAGDMLKIVTLAPELPGAEEFIRELDSSGIVAAIGHSAANAAEIRTAIRAGARYSTHLGNGYLIQYSEARQPPLGTNCLTFRNGRPYQRRISSSRRFYPQYQRRERRRQYRSHQRRGRARRPGQR